MTILQTLVLLTVLIEFGLFAAARKLSLNDRGYRALGLAALVVGLPVLGGVGYLAAYLAWQASWRDAAEHGLLLYVVSTSTWLGWRESKPF